MCILGNPAERQFVDSPVRGNAALDRPEQPSQSVDASPNAKADLGLAIMAIG
jgi:hypothetical protein